MPVDLDIARPEDEKELARFAAVVSRSLGAPPERAAAWVERVGPRNIRVVRRGDEVVAGLGLLAMGHWYGGQSVRCAGITAVAVEPELRSRGIAAEMMRTALEEARREGVALSSLYATTFSVYRAAGYESAGNRLVYRLPLASLGAGARDPEMRAVAGPEDVALLRALYDERARRLSGFIDRTPYFWRRVLEPFGEDARALLVEGDAGPEGYAIIGYRPTAGPLAPNELTVRDAVARTPAAARRIVRLLADHRSTYRSALLASGPGDPLLMTAREERLEIAEAERLLLRVVDVRGALEARGWSPAVRGEVHFEVRDALLPENARRWVLEVAAGRAEVREGGSGAVVIDVRGVAALYSGFLPAEELRVAGLCDGQDADLAAATALFAGPAPWAPDMF